MRRFLLLCCLLGLSAPLYAQPGVSFGYAGAPAVTPDSNSISSPDVPRPQPTADMTLFHRISTPVPGDKTTVIFFYSYVCVECFAWVQRLQSLVPNLVAGGFTYRDMPTAYSPNSTAAAEVVTALAVSDQGRFIYSAWDALVHNVWQLNSKDSFEKYLADAGGDKDKFNRAVSGSAVANAIFLLPKMAKQYDVEYAPAIVIGGRYKITLEDGGKNGEKILPAMTAALLALKTEAAASGLK